MIRIGILLAVWTFASLVCSGCAQKSIWQAEFTPGPEGSAAPLPAAATVSLREAPWERVQAALREIHTQIIGSRAPFDEWPADKRAAVKARLLDGLQVSADSATVDVLGWSEFRTTERINASDGALEKFARSIGASNVVWSRSYLGKADRIESTSVTEFRENFNEPADSARMDGRRGARFGPAPVWRPVTREDEYAWLAYFLRQK